MKGDRERLRVLQMQAEAGTLTDFELEELIELLLGDPDAFEDYLADLQLQAGLTWQLSGLRQSSDYFDAELAQAEGDNASTQNEMSVWEQVVDQALASRRQREIEADANARLAAQQAEEARLRRYRLDRHEPDSPRRVVVIPKVVAWLGLAAAIALAALLVVQLNPPAAPMPRPSAQVAPDRTPEARAFGSAPVLATLVRTLDARWDDDAASWSGGTGLRRGEHRLSAGRMRSPIPLSCRRSHARDTGPWRGRLSSIACLSRPTIHSSGRSTRRAMPRTSCDRPIGGTWARSGRWRRALRLRLGRDRRPGDRTLPVYG
ncbi:hypothetical protein OT109_02955 [Phycisphaeraceae bacterium D3-23]